MSKQITARELAEIVTALLLKPELLGELETSEAHSGFMHDIGEVVANRCGGQTNGINGWDLEGKDYFDSLDDEEAGPLLSVSPNDSLPSLQQNVWACYDPQGWEGEVVEGLEAIAPLTPEAIRETRDRIRGLLAWEPTMESCFRSVPL